MPHTMLDYYMPSFNLAAMEPAGATREERKIAREEKRKHRNHVRSERAISKR